MSNPLEDALREAFTTDVTVDADRFTGGVRAGVRRRRQTRRAVLAAAAATVLVAAGVAVLAGRAEDRVAPSPAPTGPPVRPSVTLPSATMAVETVGDDLLVTANVPDCGCTVLLREHADRWSAAYRFPVEYVEQLAMAPDGRSGWAASEERVWRTHDGGTTWSEVARPAGAPAQTSFAVAVSATDAWLLDRMSSQLWRSPVDRDDLQRFEVPGVRDVWGVAVVGGAVVVDEAPEGEGNVTTLPHVSTDGGTTWRELPWPCADEHVLRPVDDALFTTCQDAETPEATIYRWLAGTDEFVGFASEPGPLVDVVPLSADSLLLLGNGDVLVTSRGTEPVDFPRGPDVFGGDIARDGDRLVQATTDGLFASTDGGKTWRPVR